MYYEQHYGLELKCRESKANALLTNGALPGGGASPTEASVWRLPVGSEVAFWRVTEAGLFQYGHRKDHCPDLPPRKLMLATLDLFGLSIATEVVSGQNADDPLYIPAIQQVRQALSQSGLLYVGDSKMASLATRCFLQTTGGDYLCPLGGTQIKAEAMQTYLDPVEQGAVELQEIHYNSADGHSTLIARGDEQIQTKSGLFTPLPSMRCCRGLTNCR